MKKDKIAAVIVTFNRLELLQKTIKSIREQSVPVDSIIVVNNGSTDGTLEWLENQSDLVIITQSNLGCSGGQHTGLKYAFDKGYDWFWIMDDDVVAENDCLEKLITADCDCDIKAPLRYSREGSVFFNDAISYNLTNPFKSFWAEIISEKHLKSEIVPAVGITFEGPLIHRNVIEKIGLPDKNFFIYADDTEYFIRADRAGFRICIVKSAKMYRLLQPANYKQNFDWKYYYIIRNIIIIQRLYGNFFVRLLRPLFYVLRWLFRCKSIKQVRTTFRAFIDALRYKPYL